VQPCRVGQRAEEPGLELFQGGRVRHRYIHNPEYRVAHRGPGRE
jgi:hypothetical protein